MLKVLINNEEVVANQNFTINKHMLNTPSVILNNVCPKSWCENRNYSGFYHPLDYSKCKIMDVPTQEESVGQYTKITNSGTITKKDLMESEITQLDGNTTQSGTPTPSSPQPINVVSGRQTITISNGTDSQSYEINLGDNLFDSSSIIMKDYVGSNPTIRASSRQSLYLEKGTYTFSTNLDLNTYGVAIDILPNTPPSTSYNTIQTTGYITSNTKTFTVNTAGYFVATFKKGSNQTFTLDEITPFNYQLEKGSSASSFTPYKTPIELCKIGNYQDFIKKGTGKNLFSLTNIGNNGTGRTTYEIQDDNIIITTLSSGTYRNIYKTIDNLTIGQPYTIKINNHNDTSTNKIAQWGVADTNGTYYGGIKTLSSTQTITFTPTETSILFRVGYLSNSCNEDDTLTIGKIQLEKGATATPYEPYGTKGTWYIEKQIGKVVLNGSENWGKSGSTDCDRFYVPILDLNTLNTSYGLSNYYKYNVNLSTTLYEFKYEHNSASSKDRVFINYSAYGTTTLQQYKTWLSNNNVSLYYVLNTPTYTEITDSELISQLNAPRLFEGLNNVSISSPYLSTPITFHYNYCFDELLFCGIVKNSGNISLNPREPHYSTLQILDFKDFLSTGETLDYVIYQKTILEAIQQVINSISDYGFVLGNVNILNSNDIIGAYSTKDKTAYDVFNYIADITQSRWTTRMIDENTVAIDFYDPTLMPQGTEIDYTESFFKNNLIDDMKYSYGTNNYRNKQVMVSNQVYSNIAQNQVIIADGYQKQFQVEQPIGKINSILLNDIPMSFATNNEKEIGYAADFYYTPGNNYFESDILISTGAILQIEYIAIIEGRQVITNTNEITRINESTGRKGIVARYENRNDATTSTELQKIGESYIKYKGTPEIKLTIKTRKNLWEVGQRVQFNAPINELNTEYMVRTKKIDYFSSVETLFYTFELISSFNSETEINYFDNQRAKSKGNIGDGEYISRNVDIENTANIIFYDTTTTEIQVVGDNTLNSTLNSPLKS